MVSFNDFTKRTYYIKIFKNIHLKKYIEISKIRLKIHLKNYYLNIYNMEVQPSNVQNNNLKNIFKKYEMNNFYIVRANKSKKTLSFNIKQKQGKKAYLCGMVDYMSASSFLHFDIIFKTNKRNYYDDTDTKVMLTLDLPIQDFNCHTVFTNIEYEKIQLINERLLDWFNLNYEYLCHKARWTNMDCFYDTTQIKTTNYYVSNIVCVSKILKLNLKKCLFNDDLEHFHNTITTRTIQRKGSRKINKRYTYENHYIYLNSKPSILI